MYGPTARNKKEANQTTLNRNRQKKAEDKEEDDNWLVSRRFFEWRIEDGRARREYTSTIQDPCLLNTYA
jgi:hypothetical protein